MTRLAQLPPALQALERRRQELARRLGYLGSRSARGRKLRSEQVRLMRQLLALETRLGTAPDEATNATDASQRQSDARTFRHYWWTDR